MDLSRASIVSEPAQRPVASGSAVPAACTLVQNIQHSRAEARVTLFRPIEKVSKETHVHSGNTFMREYSQHLSGAHSSIPLFCTSFPPIATASQGTDSGRVFGEFNVVTVSACWLCCIAAFASATDMEVSPY